MKTAVRNQKYGAQIVLLLLGRGFQKIYLTVRSNSCATCTIPALLEKTFLETCVTENVVRAAVMSGNISVLEVLRDEVDLNTYAPEWGEIAKFISAARDGNDDMIQQLLR